MATIFHLALASEWAAAERSGEYTTSTLGRSLAEEGFIHASRGDQWTGVRERFYADVTEPLVLLQIDTGLLDVPVVEEPAVPGGSETFPHIYGRLPVTAVTKAIPLSATPSTQTTLTAAAHARTPTPTPATGQPRPGANFSRFFIREMFFNASVAMLAIVASCIGIGIGLGMESEKAPGIGGLIGLAIGIVVAARLHRRRKVAQRAT